MTSLQSPCSLVSNSNDVLQRVVHRQYVVGRNGKRFDSLASQSTQNNLCVLRSFMSAHRPAATLEIGLAHGASAAVVAACHRERAQPPTGQHVAIDPYQRSVWDDSGRLTLEQQQ